MCVCVCMCACVCVVCACAVCVRVCYYFPSQTNADRLVVTAHFTSTVNVTNFDFQVAVPKVTAFTSPILMHSQMSYHICLYSCSLGSTAAREVVHEEVLDLLEIVQKM